MGIDPVTHKPKNDAIMPCDGGQSKNAANLSHMAQWESARLEAEARLARESKLRSSLSFTSSSSASASTSSVHPVLKPWNNNNGGWLKSTDQSDLESPKSTLTLSENTPPIMPMIEFVGTSGSCEAAGMVKEEGGDQRDWNHSSGSGNPMSYASSLHHELTISNMEGTWTPQEEPLLRIGTGGGDDAVAEKDQGFTNLLLNTNSDDQSLSEEDGGGDSNNWDGGAGSGILCADNKNYWNSILNLVNSNSPSHSPTF